MKIKFPRKRTVAGYFTRQFIGGIMDGRSESVPMFRGEKPLKLIVDKSSWQMPQAIKTSNIYKLTEPTHKPKSGEIYLYEYQP